MEFVIRISKIIIGVAVAVLGLGIAFKDTIQTHMYAYMHSRMHKSHSANGTLITLTICLAFAVRMRRKLNLTSLRSCLKTSTL